MNPREIVSFHKSIVLSQYEGYQSNIGYESGQIRYNRTLQQFEGYHDIENADTNGNQWRPFHLDIASSTHLGGIKIGENLIINPRTGVLSAITNGNSRIKNRIIIISNNSNNNIGDFNNIIDALTYTNEVASIANPIGDTTNNNPVILEFTSGLHNLNDGYITIPNGVIIRGNTSILSNSTLKLKTCIINDITLQNMVIIIENNNGDTIKFNNVNTIGNTQFILNKSSNIEFIGCNFKNDSNILLSNNSNFIINHCIMKSKNGPVIKCYNENYIYDNPIKIIYSNIESLYSHTLEIENCYINILYSQISCYTNDSTSIKINSSIVPNSFWSSNNNNNLFEYNIISSENILYHISCENTTFSNGIYYINNITNNIISTQNIEIIDYHKINNKIIINTSQPNLIIKELYQIQIKYCIINGNIINTQNENNITNDNFVIISHCNNYIDSNYILENGMYIDNIPLIVNSSILPSPYNKLKNILRNYIKIGCYNTQPIIKLEGCEIKLMANNDRLQLPSINLKGYYNSKIISKYNSLQLSSNSIFKNIEFHFNDDNEDKNKDIAFQLDTLNNITFNKCIFLSKSINTFFNINKSNDIVFNNCKFICDNIISTGIDIYQSNVKIFDCIIKFKAEKSIDGICINNASIVRITNTDINIECNDGYICAINIDSKIYKCKVWLNSINYQLNGIVVKNIIN